MDQSWSAGTENIPYRIPKEWLEVAGLEKKHCNSLMMWNPWPWSWMQLGRCSSSGWVLFRKHDQKGHISKRQEGTNRQAWNMTNVRMKVQRSSLTTLHWPPWRVLAIWTEISFAALHSHALTQSSTFVHLLKLTRSFLHQFQWFRSLERKPKRPNGWTNSWRLDSSPTFAFPEVFNELCKQEKCRLDICLEDSSWDVLWRDLARQVRGHGYGHLARFWPRCLSVRAPSVWQFSWKEFGMYLITLNDLQHVNCWPVSMCHSSGLHSILQWVLVQKQSSGSRRSILANIWSTMVVRGRGLAVPTNPWNIQHGPTWTPNCSKLKGKSFSNYHDSTV